MSSATSTVSSTVQPGPERRVPHIAAAALERARLTVVPRRRTTAPRVPFVALVSLLLVGGVVGLLMFNTSMQQASYTATSLDRQATTLAEREEGLKSDLENLRDPDHVARQAQRLGMVIPPNPAVLSLADGVVRGEATPATADHTPRLDPRAPVRPGASATKKQPAAE